MRILRYGRDLRTLTFISLILALTIWQWLIGNSWTLWLIPICFLTLISNMILHNHMHCRTFNSPVLNRLMDYALTFLTGIPATQLHTAHTLNHHSNINNEDDWICTSLVNFKWNLINLLVFPIVAAKSLIKNKSLFLAKQKYKKLKNKERNEMIFLIIILIALLILKPKATLIYIVLPRLIGQYCLIALTLVQHDGCDSKSEIDSSTNFTGKILNWLTFNSGYHTIHHMKPGVHWTLLPEYHDKYVKPLINPNLESKYFARTLFRLYIWPGRRFDNIKLTSEAIKNN